MIVSRVRYSSKARGCDTSSRSHVDAGATWAGDRSTATTSTPRSVRCRVKWLPMNPPAPVTTALRMGTASLDGSGRVMPDRVAENPPVPILPPEMWRAKLVGQFAEGLARHLRPPKRGRRLRELLRADAEVVEDLLGEPLRPLAVEPLHERHALLPRDVAGPDLLGRVVGGPADAELDVGRPVVEVVD